MGSTSIEWTEATWNPVTGCTKVSTGCRFCYAETVALRFWKTQYPEVLSEGCLLKTRPRTFTDVQCHEDRLDQPLRWKRGRRIFVNSMSDLFHEDVPFDFIDRVFAVMALAPRHTFQVLTKRAERMREYMSADKATILDRLDAASDDWTHSTCDVWPLPNVWLGTSVENQQYADVRIPLLLQTPAAVRFLSVEPLLGPVTIREHLMAGVDPGRCSNCGKGHGFTRCPNYGGISPTNDESRCAKFKRANFAIDLVIVGGESGPGARPCDLAWIRSIVAQCKAAGVSAFVKQLGAKPVGDCDPRGQCERSCHCFASGARRLTDKKGGDMAEWPADLRVREFPNGIV